jgi:hypothetical protein
MSFLDKVFKKGDAAGADVKLKPDEAFAAIAVVAMAADGYATDEELRTLSTDLYRMQLFKDYSDEAIGHMLDKLLNVVQRQGADVLFAAAKISLPEELRDTAYAIATDMVLTDGTLATEEQAFLDQLRDELAIDPAKAEMLVEAMSIKNRG